MESKFQTTYRFIGMSLINRFGKSRTVQHNILVWIKWFQVDYATNNGENYTISLKKNLHSKSERERELEIYFILWWPREELECEWNHLYWIPLLSHVGCWIEPWKKMRKNISVVQKNYVHIPNGNKYFGVCYWSINETIKSILVMDFSYLV